MDEEESSSSTPVKAQPPPRKRRRLRKKKTTENEEYAENKSLSKKIHQKFSSKQNSRKADENPFFEVRDAKVAVKNSGNHEMTVSRTLEFHMNKLFQWEEQTDTIISAYTCALCNTPGMRKELFGPYCAMLSPIKHWPAFLTKKPSSKKPAKVELWFHGSCALWAPNLHLVGSQLTNLEVQMETFLSQSCSVCRKPGASVAVQNKKNTFVHYPCARNKGYKLDEHALLCNS